MTVYKPWEKDRAELNHRDWKIACGHHKVHSARTLDLRCADALAFHAGKETDRDTGDPVVWPTQQTIAEFMGVDPRQARLAIASLATTGAVQILRIGDLAEGREAIRRDARGVLYALSLDWAFETFKEAAERRKTARQPMRLVAGKLQKKLSGNRTAAVLHERTAGVLSDRTATVLLNSKGNSTREHVEGGEASTVEGLAMAGGDNVVAFRVKRPAETGPEAFFSGMAETFPVPETDDAAEMILAAEFGGRTVSPAAREYFRKQLYAGKLRPGNVSTYLDIEARTPWVAQAIVAAGGDQ